MPSVTRRTGAARARRRAEVEGELVAALERLIAGGSGFTPLTLSRLVGEAGISRTSFYTYFDSKTDVLRAWFDAAIGTLVGAPPSWHGPDGPSYEELRAAMARVCAAYRPRAALFAAVYETAAYEPGMRERVAAARATVEARVRRHVARGAEAGWVTADLDPREAAAWLVDMAERGLEEIVAATPDDDLDTVVGAWADVTWFTLYAPARAASPGSSQKTRPAATRP